MTEALETAEGAAGLPGEEGARRAARGQALITFALVHQLLVVKGT